MWWAHPDPNGPGLYGAACCMPPCCGLISPWRKQLLRLVCTWGAAEAQRENGWWSHAAEPAASTTVSVWGLGPWWWVLVAVITATVFRKRKWCIQIIPAEQTWRGAIAFLLLNVVTLIWNQKTKALPGINQHPCPIADEHCLDAAWKFGAELSCFSWKLDIRKTFSKRAVMHWLSCPGSGEVIIRGGVQELRRCGTEGSGLAGSIGGGSTLGPDDVRGLFQPSWLYDSALLRIPHAIHILMTPAIQCYWLCYTYRNKYWETDLLIILPPGPMLWSALTQIMVTRPAGRAGRVASQRPVLRVSCLFLARPGADCFVWGLLATKGEREHWEHWGSLPVLVIIM